MAFERRFTFDGSPIYLFGEKTSGFSCQGGAQDFFTLRDRCIESGSLFVDPEFPATDKSLFYTRHAESGYEWKRPDLICGANERPRFFEKGYSRFDVRQGKLGDCWFLAAAANLTRYDKLFSRVVCDDNSFDDKYAGIFHFRFWQYCNWVEVVIDDRLPTLNGKLVYLHSNEKNEFWSALLEKAYAKLHGSYEALNNGSASEALIDFTGGVTEFYNAKESPPNFFDIIRRAFARNSMMGCSIKPNPEVKEEKTEKGLILGHTYSITHATMVDIVTRNKSGKIPLVRLRNPWGNEDEWSGSFGDKTIEWNCIPESAKKEIDLSFDIDGEFWMSFGDFLRHFDYVEICNLPPDCFAEDLKTDIKHKWNTNVLEGKWVVGISAGGCGNHPESFHRNPQYVMTIDDPDHGSDDGSCTVIISLMQKNSRLKRNMGVDFRSIGFAIFTIYKNELAQKPQNQNFFEDKVPIAKTAKFNNFREINSRFQLPPGSYLIVPSTFLPNQEGEFVIRIFSEGCHTFVENDEFVGLKHEDDKMVSNGRLHQNNPIREKLPTEGLLDDTVLENEIDWMELKRILDNVFDEGE